MLEEERRKQWATSQLCDVFGSDIVLQANRRSWRQVRRKPVADNLGGQPHVGINGCADALHRRVVTTELAVERVGAATDEMDPRVDVRQLAQRHLQPIKPASRRRARLVIGESSCATGKLNVCERIG